MMKAIIFDCGGVMVYPPTEDWMLPPGYEAVLGADFLDRYGAVYRRAKAANGHLLPDGRLVTSPEREREMLLDYYRAVLVQGVGLTLTPAQIDELATQQALGNERYGFFDDVKPYMAKWRENGYLLGMVSDAPPSLERILRVKGVWKLLDAAVLSCYFGAFKPDPKLFWAVLERLGVRPEEAVFVDDVPDKLSGARRVGIHCVQMRRTMPARFDAAPAWDGEKADGFEALDRWLSERRETPFHRNALDA